MDSINRRIIEAKRGTKWLDETQKSGLYFYLQPLKDLKGAWVKSRGRNMLMFASCSYLDLLGHPKIEAAVQQALSQYGTGTHGSRILAGSLPLHEDLERAIARFHNAEAAIVFSSGYVTNLATISALVGPDDYVICDKLDHASIMDGCQFSRAKLIRFRHNDMDDLERRLRQTDSNVGRLVIIDAVFSMDGDVANLPEVSRICREHGAMLMVDEAHSLGVLGKTGRGIEEHFGLENVVDIKMGTLSKTIPSMGGYVAGRKDLISYLKHVGRAFVFSGALSPILTAAAIASLEVIEEEPERIRKLWRNTRIFLEGLKARGFNTLNSDTPIVPIICGHDIKAFQMTKLCQEGGVFALPVVSPAVPNSLARLRAAVTAAHSEEDIAFALGVFESAGKTVGVI